MHILEGIKYERFMTNGCSKIQGDIRYYNKICALNRTTKILRFYYKNFKFVFVVKKIVYRQLQITERFIRCPYSYGFLQQNQMAIRSLIFQKKLK
jgi:hypothetical protein